MDGGATPGRADPGTSEVAVTDLAFRPATLAVAPGATLVFTNGDAVGHTVTEGTDGITARGARFDEELPPGGRVSVTLVEAGTVAVTCRVHPRMQLSVSVGAAGSSAGTPTPPGTAAPDPYDDGY